MHIRARFLTYLLLASIATFTGCGEGDLDAPTVVIDDELSADQDNGAQGRNPFNNPADVAPIDACADALVESDQSLVLRVLPKGPTNADGSLAFTSGVCVYLPPNYANSRLRYPVLYLLHGGGGDAADWVTSGGIRAIMDGLIQADPVNAAIVVMPDGTDAQWHDSFDGRLRNQEYLFDYLIPYIDRHFRTIARRHGRVIDGLSNGGYGAMHFSAKRPDRFIAAGAMSSNLEALTFPGLGDPATSPAYRPGNLPVDLAANLDQVDLTMDIGTECITDRERDNCLTFLFEQVFVPANRAFTMRVDEVRDADDALLEYRETEGGHSWNWWPLWLRERHLPFLLARTTDPQRSNFGIPEQPPVTFRYRSIANDFSVWGYDVHVERAVREFLDLTDVRFDGLTVQGSGQVTIATAPRYLNGRRYVVSGATDGEQIVVADDLDRLVFSVDLGPSHTFEQFTPEANALEAAGDYWVVRTVSISGES